MLDKPLLAALAFFPLVWAGVWPRGFSASPSAGETVSAVFPPGVTETFDATAVFPPPSVVGFPGPTATGDEAAAIATAPVPAKMQSYFPLVNPSNFFQFWGNLAPWSSLPSKIFGLPNASPQIPNGFELNSVHLWHRHGARYPIHGDFPTLFATRLHGAVTNGTGFTASKNLKFLNSWTYKFGAEILTPFGREELFDLGVGFRVKYGSLLKKFTALPVFRTTSQDRMVHSALNFAAGFFGVPMYTTDYHQVIVIEGPGSNNTGAPDSTCTNAAAINDLGIQQAFGWITKYLTPAVSRLQSQIQGFNLTLTDVFGMQEACAFETVALGYSEFCDLFTEDEWKGYSHANDIVFWYSYGFGSPVAAAQGIGYVQELVARLTGTPIQIHNSTTNSTIDDSRITMPLNQSIYVDATHDTTLSMLLVALNMTSLAKGGPLPTDHIPQTQSFVVSQVAPFASNLVAQVLSKPPSTKPSHIRFLLNDAALPLTGIKGCKSSSDGLCELDTFISAMRQRISEVDFAADCLANHTKAG